MVSITNATAVYKADPALKKYRDLKNIGWLILDLDIAPETVVDITVVLKGYWNAVENLSVLFDGNGFYQGSLAVPVCEEGTLATVETRSLTVTETGYLATGEVIDDGGSEVYDRGFLYSFTEVPDVTNHDGIIQAGSGLGIFTAALESMAVHEKIYVRAYAYNRCSSCYGDLTVSYGSVLIKPETEINYGSFIDARNNREYKTIQIGSQVWMAENLAYLPDDASFIKQISKKNFAFGGVYVYDYMGSSVAEAMETDNYKKYGCLYNWEYANTLCPEGWKLPSDEDWKTLEAFLGMPPEQLDLLSLTERSGGDVGSHLKSSSSDDWYWEVVSDVLVGDNSSGFNAIAGGQLYPSNFDWNRFSWLGQDAIFWTSSSDGQDYIARDLKYASVGIARWLTDKDRGFSVRCVRDESAR